MATVSFKTITNSDWNSIYIRFRQGNKFDYPYSTGIKVPKGRWSKSKQIVLPTKEVNSKSINLKLKELKVYILKEYEDAKINGSYITKEWIKERVSIFLNQETENIEVDNKIFLTSFIDSFIKDSKTRKTKNNKPVSTRTIQHYETTKNKVLSLEKLNNRRYKLVDVDIKFHSDFLNHLREDQKLRDSTIGGYIDDIRLFCRTADKKGIKVSNDYKLNEFYSPSYETNDIYFNTEEIKKIFNSEISNDKLQNARDWLIIGLYTGLRVSDLLRLTKKDIDKEFIYKKTSKTNYPVIIPIHPHIKEILKKRNGNFPRGISDQKFNDYIKDVCKLVGLTEVVEGAKMCPVVIKRNGKEKKIYRKRDGKFPKHELVSSHICRRSFASNLYGKIDTLTIMKITGHKTESQFLKYIKITPKEYAVKLKNYWMNNMDLFTVE